MRISTHLRVHFLLAGALPHNGTRYNISTASNSSSHGCVTNVFIQGDGGEGTGTRGPRGETGPAGPQGMHANGSTPQSN